MRVIALWSLLAACRYTGASHPGEASGVQIVGAAFAKEYAKPHARRLELPFELGSAGTSGTALILDYLALATAAGATYVSELGIAIQFRIDGRVMECRSQVIVEDGVDDVPARPPASATVDDPVYATTVAPWRPAAIAADVVDPELVCERHAQPVAQTVPEHASRTDAETWRLINHGEMPMHRDQIIEWTTTCSYRPTPRHVVRYAHFLAAKLAPVDWPRIARVFSPWHLHEAAPECHPVAGAGPLHHHITGLLHVTGSLGHEPLPDVMAR
jgi:hypothetical protein